MGGAYRRYAALASADRRLVLEAIGLVAAIRAFLRLSSVSSLRRMLAWYARCGGRRAAADTTLERVEWALSAATARIPASCLVQALAADTLLHRRGFVSEICLGVRKDARRSFEAHAWVQCENRIVVGAVDDEVGFTILSRLRRS
jgi:hypothetical protein